MSQYEPQEQGASGIITSGQLVKTILHSVLVTNDDGDLSSNYFPNFGFHFDTIIVLTIGAAFKVTLGGFKKNKRILNFTEQAKVHNFQIAESTKQQNPNNSF